MSEENTFIFNRNSNLSIFAAHLQCYFNEHAVAPLVVEGAFLITGFWLAVTSGDFVPYVGSQNCICNVTNMIMNTITIATAETVNFVISAWTVKSCDNNLYCTITSHNCKCNHSCSHNCNCIHNLINN